LYNTPDIKKQGGKVKTIITSILFLLLTAPTFAVIGDIDTSFAAPYSCPTGMATDGKHLFFLLPNSSLVTQ